MKLQPIAEVGHIVTKVLNHLWLLEKAGKEDIQPYFLKPSLVLSIEKRSKRFNTMSWLLFINECKKVLIDEKVKKLEKEGFSSRFSAWTIPGRTI